MGTWENDSLAKGVEVRIEFGDDGIVYTGTISNKMEYLEGTYRFSDGTQIKCSFGKSNVPTPTDLEFSDARDGRWDCYMDNQWLIVRQPAQQYVPQLLSSSSNGSGGGSVVVVGSDGDNISNKSNRNNNAI